MNSINTNISKNLIFTLNIAVLLYDRVLCVMFGSNVAVSINYRVVNTAVFMEDLNHVYLFTNIFFIRNWNWRSVDMDHSVKKFYKQETSWLIKNILCQKQSKTNVKNYNYLGMTYSTNPKSERRIWICQYRFRR